LGRNEESARQNTLEQVLQLMVRRLNYTGRCLFVGEQQINNVKGKLTQMQDTRTPLLPRLQYHLSTPSSLYHGWIMANGEKLHRISDYYEFYAVLGYSEEVRQEGKLPDEYVWERYTRAGAAMSAKCLQAQVASYLHKHSVKFNSRFSDAYAAMIGTCDSEQIDNADIHCVDCPSHPRFAY
jgi:hypothetical protein